MRKTIIVVVSAFILSIATYFYAKSLLAALATLIVIIGGAPFFFVLKKKVDAGNEIKKMENVFPEFLELMSSNLRAGMTIDQALILSSRPEFAPLDKEIMKLGKDLITGKKIERALNDMAAHIKSEKIQKTLALIISGLRSGGTLATLLQDTAVNMKERNFVDKRASSNVLMYIIFIYVAVAVGAPSLFALSTVLVKTLSNILSNIPPIDSGNTQLPFTLTQLNISPEFVTYFSVVFILVTNVLGSFVLGVISKGDEKAGLKYILPLNVVSLTIFFIVKTVIGVYFSGLV